MPPSPNATIRSSSSKIPLLIPFVQSTVNPGLKSRVNCPSYITASLCSGSLDLGIQIVHSSSMLLVVIRIHLCMPFSPTTSSKPQIPSYDTTPSESQCLHDTNAFADPRSPTETPLAPAWAATRCAHGTPVVPNQCLKSSSSLGGKVCVLMSCASSATLLSPNCRSEPLLGRFASFSTAPLLQSCSWPG
ncbi:hypothetical protein PoMZ_06049 [Pyricularia oryzae]|uniref:Uncharacterized protein n=1 Tax=Pyricularia oryzae TaxID=318829 RepID=A0A4P7NPN4_PYROR|nr:hypothetical protein PoMZ_06049 [Pyricularia oryzae]